MGVDGSAASARSLTDVSSAISSWRATSGHVPPGSALLTTEAEATVRDRPATQSGLRL